MPVIVNPFQIGEAIIEQNLQLMRASVKFAEQMENTIIHSLEIQRQTREQSQRFVEAMFEQTRTVIQTSAENTEKLWAMQQQAGERLTKQVAASFSKS